MNWPKISIVTPSFNQGKYIEQTILSVINQNYPNLEYIIIDGGSSDETISIIKKYEKYISYWVSEEDQGQSHAINKGIDKCTGDVFNWLNSDDWYEPNILFLVARAFMSDTQIKIVSGFENQCYSNGVIKSNTGTHVERSLIDTVVNCHIAQPSTFFKLNLVKEVNGVNNGLHYVMDGEMWLKILLLHGTKGFKKIDKILVNFRIHELSKTFSNQINNYFHIERSSILISLQKFISVPDFIINSYHYDIFKTDLVDFNENWQINRNIVSEEQLRFYFVKQYVIRQFIKKDKHSAYRAIKILARGRQIDLFLFKSLMKLLFK